MKKKIFFLDNLFIFFVSHILQIARAMLSEGFEVHVATEFTKYKSKFKKMGFVTHNINFNRNSVNIITLLLSLIEIFFLLRKIRPDIFHLISLKPVFLGGLISFISPVRSVVISITGLGSMFLGDGIFFKLRLILLNFIYKIIFLFPNQKVILQNNDDKKYLINYANLKSKKIKIIKGSGIELGDFKFSKIPFKKTPIILMASRLISDKGVNEYIGAIKYLKNKNFNAKFYLAGNIDVNNPSRIDRSKILFWQKNKLIFFKKYYQKISKLIKSSNIVILPSYREGFPKILMEAAASGRPVITTNVPGCRDAVKKNVTGIIIPPKNYIALADAIKNLCENKNKQIKMGLAARKYAIKNFDVKKIVNEHLDIYKKLIN